MSQDLTALVDLGSNSVRFMLVRIVRGAGYRVLRDERAQTRLGSGTDGMLPADAVAQSVDAVVRFVRAVASETCRVLAVATAAVRDAPNAAELLQLLSAEAGVDVEVSSGPGRRVIPSYPPSKSPLSPVTRSCDPVIGMQHDLVGGRPARPEEHEGWAGATRFFGDVDGGGYGG